MVRLEHKPVQGIDTAYRLDLGGLAEEPKRDCPAPNRVALTAAVWGRTLRFLRA